MSEYQQEIAVGIVGALFLFVWVRKILGAVILPSVANALLKSGKVKWAMRVRAMGKGRVKKGCH